MDYDFFNEDGEKKNAKEVSQRIPAPIEDNGYTIKPPRKKKVRWQYVVTAIAVGVVVFLSGMLACWFSLDKEIRTLLDVKKKIQQKYYYDVSDEAFYDAIFDGVDKELSGDDEVTNGEFYGAVFGGINDNLLDDYSKYMTPEELRKYMQDMEGNRAGVGLVFATDSKEPLHIIRVCGNSPAEKAGLKVGEKIVGVGMDEANILPCSTFEDFSAFLAPLENKKDFCLKILGEDGERIVLLHKDVYVESLVFYRTKTHSYTFDLSPVQRDDPMEYLDDDTAYIRLVSFTGNAAKEFDKAMDKFREEGKKNLILDLRGNGGGSLAIMQSIASYFCKSSTESKPIVAIADYGKTKQKYAADGNYYHNFFKEDSRIGLLADVNSASASECLIGCMIDYGAITYADICLAERSGVVRTFGKGIMQEIHYVNLLDGDALKLTTAEIRWPSGNSIHKRGVIASDGTATVKEGDFEEEAKEAIEAWLEK